MKAILFTTIFLCGINAAIVSANAKSLFCSVLMISQSAKTLQNEDSDEIVKAAFELYKQKKYDEAIAACLKAFEMYPKDFRPHSIAGLSYMAQWKLKSASEEFAKAISLKPDNKQIYLFKAKADNLRGAKDEAVAACRKAIEIDPSFAEAYVTIGDTLQYDEKRRAEAEEAYRMAVKVNPKISLVYENLGTFLLNQNKDEKGAEKAFRKAMELDPNRMAGRFPLGRLLVKQDRLKEARTVWEGKTTDKDNTFPNFIVVLERAENLKKATDALAQKPKDPETLLQMGSAVMEGDSWVVDGRQERAIVYFKEALEIKPNFTAVQYAICKAYIQMADTYRDKNKNVDEELVKLKQADPTLAKELEEYRKNYSGGLKTGPANFNK